MIINDLQTKQKYHFNCNKWLAIDKDDCLVEQTISVCCDLQKKTWNYIFTVEIKKVICESHLWISVFTKPTYNAFSRVERITCCFVLLYISMMMNVLYYGNDQQSSLDGLSFGYDSITTKQVIIKRKTIINYTPL